MAEIKNFFKEREKREPSVHEQYDGMIRKHRMTTLHWILLAIVVVIGVMVAMTIQYNRKTFTDYEIMSSEKRETTEEATDCLLKNCILTYSKDGAHCTNTKGVVTWNQTFQMQDMQMATCQDVVALADYNGREIFVQNTEKVLGQIATTMPIKNLTVATNGNVSAVLEDTDATWINTYNAEGEMLYTGQTHMSDSGYPAALSLSPNGELLAVSYVYVDAGVLKTNIVFYNFGPVGTNQSDFMVGLYTYTDLLVPYIQYMDDNTAFAVGDGRLMIYKGNQKPTLEAEFLFTEELQSVFYSEKYIGLIYTSDVADYKHVVRVYNSDGKKVNDLYLDADYTNLFFDSDKVVAYNDTQCTVVKLDGTVKYHGDFKKTTKLMIPTGRSFRYMVVTGDSMDMIQFK